jgi:hypothetical protein
VLFRVARPALLGVLSVTDRRDSTDINDKARETQLAGLGCLR